jgi:hypothetical protein
MSPTFIVFNAQLTGSVIVLGLLLRWYVMPWLRKQDGQQALTLPLLTGATRYMGLSFLVPTLTPGMPEAFAIPTAYGDAASAVLAMVAAAANHARHPLGRPLAWAYLVLGGGDLAYGFLQGFIHGLWDHLPGIWSYIAFAAPMVILGLVTTAILLLKPNAARTA